MKIEKIEVVKNGPLRLLAEDEILFYYNGEQLKIEDRVSLCRCGKSKKQPFCDGAHKDIKPFEE